jgi:hypothetical protein
MAGSALVEAVSERRRGAIADVVAAMGPAASRSVIRALETFGKASGEIPEDAWSWDGSV